MRETEICEMSFDEKNTWAFLVIAIVGYATYIAVVLTSANGQSLPDLNYGSTMLWTISGAIVAGILANIAISIASPKEAGKRDRRDKEIGRFGDSAGHAFVIIGAVAALLLAIIEADYFWIANVIYLCFCLAAVLSSVIKLIAYRRGLPSW
jgi:hypothetical protein